MSARPRPSAPLAELLRRLAPLRAEVAGHALFGALRTPEDLRVFAATHVFAVFDFMCLLKRLQRELTCVELPWRPPADARAARLINEIVLGEESDEDGRGGHGSHLELYLRGMQELGAECGPIRRLVQALGEGRALPEALDASGAPPAAVRFVRATWNLARDGAVHEVAAAFALGREGVIPEMFQALLCDSGVPASSAALGYYFERHIYLDGDQHTPLALALLERLADGDTRRWTEMERAALEERRRLWDGILHELQELHATSVSG